MLVTRVVGSCPGCQAVASFGNISISGHTLLRGCSHCTYSQRLLLPALSKEVLYLDQSFLSHAFRGELPDFVEVAKLISEFTRRRRISGDIRGTAALGFIKQT